MRIIIGDPQRVADGIQGEVRLTVREVFDGQAHGVDISSSETFEPGLFEGGLDEPDVCSDMVTNDELSLE